MDVVIAGAGPNGLMLACELSLAGMQPVVLEQLHERGESPKANGVIGQVVRLLDHRGLYERLRGEPGAPQAIPAFLFGALPLNLSGLDANPMYGLGVPQRRLEQVLEERARELGVELRRGHELVRLDQREDGVTLRVRGPDGRYEMRTGYLVGCDGGHSTVRKQAGIGFPGVTAPDVTSRTGHVAIEGAQAVPGTVDLEVPGVGRIGMYAWQRTEHGAYAIMPLPSGALTVSVMEWERPPTDDDAPMTTEELRASLRRVLGADLPITEPQAPGPHLLRRLVGRNTRLAETYRKDRVLLVGDAAHVHSAVGAPGLNLGLQDAANLGWKLAAEVSGWAPPGLLDTYHTERHPASERVAMHSQAQMALMAPGSGITALRQVFGELLQDKDTIQRIAGLMAGADVRYAAGAQNDEAAGHPLTGRFAPDLMLTTETGPARLADLMRNARPLLLDLSGGTQLSTAAAGWKDRVDTVSAHCTDPPAHALLIRPDGYVAWAATLDEPIEHLRNALGSALTTWFGTEWAGSTN
ncbi:FAD-dependent monooxygenase [Streptomyces antioxidans]|uniref:FAD-dependent monooxygenase n=1 Tax=Streptomyces antioxidans TaxID=1507734 RepID=UPI001F0B1934|nr:FAD-dependent monooxygenase [Streptomyces antioxidans]